MRGRALPVALAALLCALAGGAGAQTVDLERSVIALLTHKGGWAEGRAHDHVIAVDGAASGTHVELTWTGDPATAAFGLTAIAGQLEVDPLRARGQLRARFEELGLRSGDFREIDDQQRAKVRESMLGREQLDAERYPAIGARLLELREGASTVGAVEMTHRGRVELSAHGRTATVPFAGRVERDGEQLTLEATGRLRHGDLGIEPYSAFLGAVKNRPEIDLYLRLVARVAPQS